MYPENVEEFTEILTAITTFPVALPEQQYLSSGQRAYAALRATWDKMNVEQISFFQKKLREGKVNGNYYTDDRCGCLKAWAALVQLNGNDIEDGDIDDLHQLDIERILAHQNIAVDACSPEEQALIPIGKGDTPKHSKAARIIDGWITDYLKQR